MAAFHKFTRAVGAYGKGYTGPGYNALRGSLLKDARQRLDTELEPFWQQASATGIVLISDGWTDTNHRPLMNVLAATPKGHCFLFAENCEGEFKDAAFVADLWTRAVEQVGAENVFAFISDGASVNVAAGKTLETRCDHLLVFVWKAPVDAYTSACNRLTSDARWSCRFPHITWVHCTAHCLDLMLKDIGQLPFFSAVIADQKRVIKFITNHHATLGIFRGLAEKELLKTGAHLMACICV